MPRYRLRTLFIALLLASCALAAMRIWPYSSAQAIHEVNEGMSETEVIELLGHPRNVVRYDDGTYYAVYYQFPIRAVIVNYDQKSQVEFVDSTAF